MKQYFVVVFGSCCRTFETLKEAQKHLQSLENLSGKTGEIRVVYGMARC